MAVSPQKPSAVKRRAVSKRQKTPRSVRKKSSPKKKKPQMPLLHSSLLIGLEYLGLMSIGVASVVVALGYSGNRFSGTGFFNSYLPFAAGVIGVIILEVILLGHWQKLRRWLRECSAFLPPSVVIGLALVIGGLAPPEFFSQAFLHYRILVGGKEEASRVALMHQVYAAYRRMDRVQMTKMINMSQPYTVAIEEAGAVYGVDGDLLKGLAATESSFLPRTSSDGGQGLFQVTKAPATVTMEVNKLFSTEHRVLTDARYNAYLGAATLRHYLTEMKDDLFLGLLAYNIGPANGGLRFIMDQYGATDFITIQPYLMQMPRDYPIRVLSYSLAFRLRRQEGQLLAYEEGKNAIRIQAVGIPGLR
ncbi:MAG: lytic transglycosylase domain-containing protein [Proteobacteria bacterium]|nr:lytic transglycosylase domain-containing protein [Pseudomonadota bacterium]MBU1059242.1 lytic transglycosylase domain-containing protein [Pseudomonadota bacterium]